MSKKLAAKQVLAKKRRMESRPSIIELASWVNAFAKKHGFLPDELNRTRLNEFIFELFRYFIMGEEWNLPALNRVTSCAGESMYILELKELAPFRKLIGENLADLRPIILSQPKFMQPKIELDADYFFEVFSRFVDTSIRHYREYLYLGDSFELYSHDNFVLQFPDFLDIEEHSELFGVEYVQQISPTETHSSADFEDFLNEPKTIACYRLDSDGTFQHSGNVRYVRDPENPRNWNDLSIVQKLFKSNWTKSDEKIKNGVFEGDFNLTFYGRNSSNDCAFKAVIPFYKGVISRDREAWEIIEATGKVL